MPWISNLLPFAKLKTAENVSLWEPAEKKDRRERELSRRLCFTNKDLTNLFTNYVFYDSDDDVRSCCWGKKKK